MDEPTSRPLETEPDLYERERSAAQRTSSILPLAIAFEGGLAVAAIVLGWIFRIRPLELIAWRASDVGFGLAATIPLLIGLWLVRRAHDGPLGRLNAIVDRLIAPLFAGCTIVQLALVSSIAGLGEELLFRGVVQPVLGGWFGVPIGVALASVVFGLLHSVTPTYAVIATLVGAYFGWLLLATGNLLSPIVTHSVYDFVALVYLTRALPHSLSANFINSESQ